MCYPLPVTPFYYGLLSMGVIGHSLLLLSVYNRRIMELWIQPSNYGLLSMGLVCYPLLCCTTLTLRIEYKQNGC